MAVNVLIFIYGFLKTWKEKMIMVRRLPKSEITKKKHKVINILTSMHIWNMDSRWYTPDSDVVSIDI